jgi:hypothetical protein
MNLESSPKGGKGQFLPELVQACSVEILTLMAGGDFNIIRSLHEKKTIPDRMIDDLSYLMLL